MTFIEWCEVSHKRFFLISQQHPIGDNLLTSLTLNALTLQLFDISYPQIRLYVYLLYILISIYIFTPIAIYERKKTLLPSSAIKTLWIAFAPDVSSSWCLAAREIVARFRCLHLWVKCGQTQKLDGDMNSDHCILYCKPQTKQRENTRIAILYANVLCKISALAWHFHPIGGTR